MAPVTWLISWLHHVLRQTEWLGLYQGQIASKTVSVYILCVRVLCWQAVGRSSTTDTYCHFRVSFMWMCMCRVTRFACLTSSLPPVTVQSFLWPLATLLMFLHILAAQNTTAEEEWQGYEACVRVTAPLEVMWLRGCTVAFIVITLTRQKCQLLTEVKNLNSRNGNNYVREFVAPRTMFYACFHPFGWKILKENNKSSYNYGQKTSQNFK